MYGTWITKPATVATTTTIAKPNARRAGHRRRARPRSTPGPRLGSGSAPGSVTVPWTSIPSALGGARRPKREETRQSEELRRDHRPPDCHADPGTTHAAVVDFAATRSVGAPAYALARIVGLIAITALGTAFVGRHARDRGDDRRAPNMGGTARSFRRAGVAPSTTPTPGESRSSDRQSEAAAVGNRRDASRRPGTAPRRAR